MKTSAPLKKVFLIPFFLFLSFTSYGKNKITITVVEKETGSRIPFAIVSIVEKANNKPIGMTDLSGVLSTPDIVVGQKILVSSIGYSPFELVIGQSSNFNVSLKKGIELKEVKISALHVPLKSCVNKCFAIDTDPFICFGQQAVKVLTNEIEKQPFKSISTLKIFPNPTHGLFRLNSGVENYLLELFDCTGKLVLNFEKVNDDQSIDIDKLKAGVYFCRITKDNLILTSRLIVN